MKKEHAITLGIIAGVIILVLTTMVAYMSGKNKSLTSIPSLAAPTNHPPLVSMTNAPVPVAVQTNTTASQVDLLAAELKALKAANEEREAMLNRLLKLNEEIRRERETNTITVPVTVNVTNSPPSVTINGVINISDRSAQQSVPTNKVTAPAKKTKTPRAQAPKTQTRVPMYTITNSTSSVTTTGTNVSSIVNTQTQSFLKPQRRWSVLGLLIGEKDPISTSVPSGQSVQQGYPAPQVTVVESPYLYGYPYGYGYGGYRSPYQPVYSGYGSSERRLFGVRFHSR